MIEGDVKQDDVKTLPIPFRPSNVLVHPDVNLITPCDEYVIPVCDEEIDQLEKLLPNLMSICLENRGIGLSANQIGVLRSVFVVSVYGTIQSSYFCINPKIIRYGKDLIDTIESCLSYPGIKVQKKRHRVIDVEYVDDEGSIIKKTLKSRESFIFQHEMQHLLGLPFYVQNTEVTDASK